MAQYKTMQAPRISLGHDSNHHEALNQYQEMIQKEANEGWELVCSHTITVTQDPEPLPPVGCLNSILMLVGIVKRPEIPTAKTYYIDMMIFVKR